MKVFYSILLIALISYLIGCTSEIKNHDLPYNNDAPEYSLESQIEKTKLFSWNNYIDTSSILIIRLESNEKALLGDIHKILIDKDRIYCHDFKFSKLKVFNMKGEFLFTVGRRGNGRGEYHEIRDIDIHGEYISILDYKSIHQYNKYDGQYVDTKNLKRLDEGLNPTDFIYYNDDLFYLWSSNPDAYNPGSLDYDYYRLYKFVNGKKTGSFYKYINKSLDGHRFYKIHNEDNFFVRPASGDYKVYKIMKDTINMAFTIDPEKYSLPEDFFEINRTTPRLLNHYMQSNYFKELKDIFQLTDKYLYFSSNGPRGYRYNGIIDCKKDSVIDYGRENYPYNPRIYYSTGEYIFGIYIPHRIKNRINDGFENESLIFDKLKKIKQEISENDNPIIVRFKPVM